MSSYLVRDYLTWTEQFCPRFKSLSIKGNDKRWIMKYVVYDASIAVLGPDQGLVTRMKLFLVKLPFLFMSTFFCNGTALQVLDLKFLPRRSVDPSDCENCMIETLCSPYLGSLKDLRLVQMPRHNVESSRLIFESKWNRPQLRCLSLTGFSWVLGSNNEMTFVDSGDQSTTEWRPREMVVRFEQGLDELIQQRLRDLPNLERLTLDDVPFMKLDV